MKSVPALRWIGQLQSFLGRGALALTLLVSRSPAADLGPDPAHWRESLSFRTLSPRGHVGSPVMSAGRLFIQTPFPHTIFALDAEHPDAPEIWRFSPSADGRAGGLACCGGAVAGPAIDRDLVIAATVDGHVIALRQADGTKVWDAAVADPGKGEALREAPLIAAGKVFVGESGDDNGARGFVAALDEATGRELWRRYSTGPDEDVGLGDAFRSARGADLGVASWPSGAWKRGGGGLAGPLLYDAEFNQILYATGHPAPWNPDQRQGDNYWTSGIFARDAETGAALWFASISRHDPFAFGAGAAGVLVDRDISGARRKLLLHADPNGYVYKLDRRNGAILSAAPYAFDSTSQGYDSAAGALRYRPDRTPRTNATVRDACPGWPGALGAPAALSPDGRLLLIPASRLCMDIEARDVSYIKGTAFVGADLRAKIPRDGQGGALVAWDIDAGKPAWIARETFPLASTPLVLERFAVYGALDGVLKTVDLATGQILGRRVLDNGVASAPVALDGGRIGVLAGAGGRFGAVADTAIDVRDATAAHGLGNMRPVLPSPRDASGRLYVFAP